MGTHVGWNNETRIAAMEEAASIASLVTGSRIADGAMVKDLSANGSGIFHQIFPLVARTTCAEKSAGLPISLIAL